MNFQIEIRKLEKLRVEALNKVKDLRYDISKYDESISELNRIHKKDIENSLKLTKILNNLSKEKVFRVVNLMFKSLQNSEKYRNYYKDIDLENILQDEDCLTFIVIECGESIIKKLMLKFKDVGFDKELNEYVFQASELTSKNVGISYMDGKDINFNISLFNKFTKKSVYEELIKRDALLKQGHPINKYDKLHISKEDI